MSLEADIDKAVRTLYKLGDVVPKHRQRIAALGGAYMSAAIESAAPVGKKVHYRYSTPKLVKGIRAPKGSGNKVASYFPGNLAASINVLKFRRAQSKVFVGAKLAKGRLPKGIFGPGRRTDGYYLHMVEKGTKHAGAHPFYVRSADQAAPRTLSIMLREWEKLVNQFERQNRV